MVLDKRAASPTENVVSSVTGKKKDIYPKIAVPNLFYGDRKKFKTYYTQIRLYL
jgi:hypothetical protein